MIANRWIPRNLLSGGGNCNCDAKSGSWAEDAGSFVDDWAQNVPITQMRFGDTATGSGEGYHTLGKVNCYISKGKIGKRHSQEIATSGNNGKDRVLIKGFGCARYIICDIWNALFNILRQKEAM